MNQKPEFLESLELVTEALEELAIDYFVTGSLASASHGVARATADADIVVDLSIESYEALLDRLGPDFYVPDSFAREAIRTRGMFNIIRVGALFKADMILLRATDFDANAMRRARAASPPDSYPTATPEDIILFKLQWLAASGENSQRHRQDVLGVIRAQSDHLDVNYLEECAAVLGVDSLLREMLDS